jgi:hypothetical protein
MENYPHKAQESNIFYLKPNEQTAKKYQILNILKGGDSQQQNSLLEYIPLMEND